MFADRKDTKAGAKGHDKISEPHSDATNAAISIHKSRTETCQAEFAPRKRSFAIFLRFEQSCRFYLVPFLACIPVPVCSSEISTIIFLFLISGTGYALVSILHGRLFLWTSRTSVCNKCSSFNSAWKTFPLNSKNICPPKMEKPFLKSRWSLVACLAPNRWNSTASTVNALSGDKPLYHIQEWDGSGIFPRPREVKYVEKMMASCGRLLLITGPPQSGKKTIVREVNLPAFVEK